VGGVLNPIDQGWSSGTEHLVKVKGGDGADDTSVRLLGGGSGNHVGTGSVVLEYVPYFTLLVYHSSKSIGDPVRRTEGGWLQVPSTDELESMEHKVGLRMTHKLDNRV